MRLDNHRFQMLARPLGGMMEEEPQVSTAVATHIAHTLALPPYICTCDIATRVNASPFVWARNLLSNRL